MKIVLDCNVIISAGLKDGVCRKALQHLLTYHTLYVSEEILAEYKEVISRPKFKATYNYLYYLIEMICELSEFVEPKKLGFTLPDQDDIIYLEAALAIEANYLITGNIKDFPMANYGITKVLTPSEFLATFEIAGMS